MSSLIFLFQVCSRSRRKNLLRTCLFRMFDRYKHKILFGSSSSRFFQDSDRDLMMGQYFSLNTILYCHCQFYKGRGRFFSTRLSEDNFIPRSSFSCTLGFLLSLPPTHISLFSKCRSFRLDSVYMTIKSRKF